jgi:hypothetical protein
MPTAVTETLQKFCETNDIRRLDADEIEELLADGEDPDWIASQAAEDKPELVESLTALLTELAPQVRTEPNDDDDEGAVIEAGPDQGTTGDDPAATAEAPDLESLSPDDLNAQLAQMGAALPPGVDARQLQQMLSSPRGQLMADFGAYCQETGEESPDEERMQQLHEEWLQTPRETLEGKRPAELLDGGRLLPEKVSTFRREQPKVGRNDPCPCGSGKKHKKCCGKGG